MAIVKKYVICEACSGNGTRNMDHSPLPSNVVEIREGTMLCPKCDGTGHTGYELLDIVEEDDINDSCRQRKT